MAACIATWEGQLSRVRAPAITVGKRTVEVYSSESPCKFRCSIEKMRSMPTTVLVDCGGRKFECHQETLLRFGSRFFTAADIDAVDSDSADFVLDFKAEAFELVLDASRIADSDVLKAICKVQEGLHQLGSSLEDLLKHLGLEWLVGSRYNLPDWDSWPTALDVDELHKLPLAGVLEDLAQRRLSPQTYSGAYATDDVVVRISEELNGLASSSHQLQHGHNSLVAQMVQVMPFMRASGVGDELARSELLSMSDYYEMPDQEYYEDELEEHVSEYWLSPAFHCVGLCRHVVDLGPRRLLNLSAVVVAYSGILLTEHCTLHIQASVDGHNRTRTIEARIARTLDTEKASLIKISIAEPIMGRLFALTLLPHSYNVQEAHAIQIHGLELYGRRLDVPDVFSLRPSPCFRFDVDSDKFGQVDCSP